MKKKVLTMFLAVCLAAGNVTISETVLAAAPEGNVNRADVSDILEIQVLADLARAEEVNEKDWDWEILEDGTVSIWEYTGTAAEVAIPSILDGKTVTVIESEAFYAKKSITKVTIPDSITAIGWDAFGECTGLKEITIPGSITEIGDLTFAGCESLERIELPDSVTAIGDSAFSLCRSLESITLPENLVTIGEGAFSACYDTDGQGMITGLGSITIPAKVTHIGKGAFSGSMNLKQITVSEGNTAYTSQDGVLFNKAKTELVAYPAGKAQTKYEIPAGVQKIGDNAFEGVENLAEVTFPSSLEEIGERGFYATFNLGNFTFPNSLKKIGDYAFAISGFTEVTIPSGVTDIGEGAFYGGDFKAINVDAANTVYASEDGILFNKAKTELLFYPGDKIDVLYVIPSGVTEIGCGAFDGSNNIASIIVPKNVTRIKRDAFNTACLEQITIQNPQCVIGETDEEGFIYDAIWEGAKIRGYENSTAQAYAQEREISFEVIVDGACAHSYVEQVTTPATCVQKGVKTFICKNCGESYTEDIPMIAHNYGEPIVTVSTCAKKGAKTYTCSDCGHSYTEELPLNEHNYQTVTQQAAPGRNGSIRIKCSVCGDISVNQIIAAPKTVALSKSTIIYNGKAQTVSVTVKDSAGKTVPAANSSVVFSNNKNVGEATVTVTFNGNYTGSIKKSFQILPKGTSLSKTTAKSKGFTVKWKKQPTQTTGYEIQYSTSNKFKGNTTRIVKVNKNKATSQTISKLKAKKKYYVRIRTYKAVKINGKSMNLYSSWSKAKNVTTKK